MDSKSSLHLLLLLSVAATFSAAFNITKILNQYPDYSVFNALLSEYGVADAINHRQTITVLAVPNGPASSLSSQPPDVAKRLASLHVVLDYYDLDKLRSLSKGTTLTTLFQTTGLASGHLGFLNVSHTKNPDGLAFGSAIPGSPLSASLVKTVAAQPYNVSVLEVSAVIFPPEIAAAPAPMKQESLARADAPRPSRTRPRRPREVMKKRPHRLWLRPRRPRKHRRRRGSLRRLLRRLLRRPCMVILCFRRRRRRGPSRRKMARRVLGLGLDLPGWLVLLGWRSWLLFKLGVRSDLRSVSFVC
ncbi:Fasciclin-like arabinogalactan protein 14 [Acorus calamus]|uniref:Fasciclin-like arabinogalactan protein 14 n=1 Tax=Acorus calamus TaxID=4465 RepID=A0AAV9CQ87_ACOCL|nr:Fasciclin-like arabinogalactan protein 14 [Acorus calamus]